MLEIFGMMDKFNIVKQLPLFSELNFFEKSLIAKKCELVAFKTSDIVYRETDSPDAFYCLVSGRVRLFVKNKDDHEQTLEYLSRGKYFGIISLLTGEPHSVTVEVINDSVILKIKKEDFDYILKRIPRLAIDLSQSLSRRLKRKDLHQKTIFESTVISVFSPAKGIGKTQYSLNLAISLHRETNKRAIFLQIGKKFEDVFRALKITGATLNIKEIGFDLPRLNDLIVRHKTGIDFLGVDYSNGSNSEISAIISILSHLTNDYHYIIIDLPAEMDQTVFKTLTQSDLVHLLTDAQEHNLDIIAKLLVDLRTNLKQAEHKIHIIVNELKSDEVVPVGKRAEILKHEIWANLPFIKEQLTPEEMLSVVDDPANEYARAVRRISRQIGQVMVGLALGCGAASGLAHVGILKVLERENIPIDIVSGSSIGAMIAAFWAAGLSAQEIEDAVVKHRVKLSGYNMGDFVFPKLGLMQPKRIAWFLKEVLKDKTFYDIRFPLKVMSTDVKTREEVAIENGSLVKAVLASSAIPGIFEPVRYGDRYLMDGGVLNPVPVAILMKMGIKKIIAVNVLPHFDPEHLEKKNISQANRTKKFQWFLDKIRPWFSPNIVDVIMSSLQAMEYVLAEASCRQADIFIRPDLEPTEWFNFYDARQFIKKGEEAAEKHIAEIKKLITE
ncbi:MAG: patatin-like phospholipase family protein [Candidatus Omnitrophota bacterium]|nr:patatin-like phospholipase family protein [Candidatus Omnitrophota bacterium]